MSLLILASIFSGETLMIFAEEFGAKSYLTSTSFWSTFIQTLVPLIIGALLVVVGYILGLRHFHNIWIVTAISFGSILIAELCFNFFYIGQLPTTGAFIGATFGVLGILAALFL